MTTQTRNVFHNSILRNQVFPTVIEENKKQLHYSIHKKEFNSIALRKPPSNYNLQIPLLPSFRNTSRNAKIISFEHNKYHTSINKTEIKNKKSLNITIGIYPMRGNSYLTKHKAKYKGSITIKDIHYNTIGTKSFK